MSEEDMRAMNFKESSILTSNLSSSESLIPQSEIIGDVTQLRTLGNLCESMVSTPFGKWEPVQLIIKVLNFLFSGLVVIPIFYFIFIHNLSIYCKLLHLNSPSVHEQIVWDCYLESVQQTQTCNHWNADPAHYQIGRIVTGWPNLVFNVFVVIIQVHIYLITIIIILGAEVP